MKKCPEGGFGTVEARIPFSQSVDCGPTMEMSPLLGSRAVDGPALTRDATAGGNFGIEDEQPVLERFDHQRSDRWNSTPLEAGFQPNSELAHSSIGLLAQFLNMSATCEPLLEALKDCLMRSDCVLKKGKLPSECLRQHTDELPDSCKSLRHAVFECKRGLVSLLQSVRRSPPFC